MGFLTWCEDCGNEMHGDSYECLHCGKELCFICYTKHKQNCPEREDGLEEIESDDMGTDFDQCI